MNLAVLQARTGSTRLPGKVLAPILGRPMLARQIERIRRARVSQLVVATSDQPGDDSLESLCAALGVACFRGSHEDVLDRVYRAAAPRHPQHVVRLTGDCPLLDPVLLDRVVELHQREGNDYTSNALRRTFPDGLDVEVVRFACLEEAWREAAEPDEREHVTPFLYRRPERYRLGCLTREPDLSGLRWTVDRPEDLSFVRGVYAALYPGNPAFGSDDVLALLERRPELAS